PAQKIPPYFYFSHHFIYFYDITLTYFLKKFNTLFNITEINVKTNVNFVNFQLHFSWFYATILPLNKCLPFQKGKLL
ncbi:MAG: hypothetical protein ACOCM8_09360, partial [Acetivibrio ethanolgignens]